MAQHLLRRRFPLWLWGLFLLLQLAGCGGPKGVPVEGTLSHQGKPLPGWFLMFESTTGKHHAWATTAADGTFSLTSQLGPQKVVPGEYRVWVDYRPGEPDPNAEPAASGEEQQAILSQFGEKDSTLKVTISGPQAAMPLELK